MRVIWLIVWFVVVSRLVSAVVIQEVLYAPNGTESGGEAVLLYNPSDYVVNLSGWSLATSVSEQDVVFKDVVVAPQGYLLVADLNWSSRKDDTSWPAADVEEIMTLKNVDSGVALRDAAGAIVDAVGWGNAVQIPSGLFSGSPAGQVKKGFALLRVGSTGNNAVDFVESAPLFPSANAILVFSTVTGVSASFDVPDDDPREGIQWRPVLGSARQFFVSGSAEGRVIVSFLNSSYEGVGVEGNFSVIVALPYWASGVHDLRIRAGSEETVVRVEVLPAPGFVVEKRPIVFEAVRGREVAARNPLVIRNIGNVQLSVIVRGSDLVGAQGLISQHNVRLKVSGVVHSLGSALLVPVHEALLIEPRLEVPVAMATGTYAGLLEVTEHH